MSNIFLAIAIVCVFIGIGFSMYIISYLSNQGVKINWLLIRLFMPKYVSQYRKMTIEKLGKPGTSYYGFVIAMISALIFAVVGLIMKMH